MRIMHLSDLHLGKRLNGIALDRDQQYILQEILKIAEEQQVDVIVVAGDVYDKSLPSVSAMNLLDEFLAEIKARQIPVIMVAGNHDSQERLAYGHRLFVESEIYLSPAYQGKVEKVVLEDEYGAVNFYLLPFLKPSMVRGYAEPEEILSYDDAVAWALKESLENLNSEARNVLIAHQFVTGSKLSDSEEVTVGGVDNVSRENFTAFDYVALGHLHTPQQAGGEWIRYCGTPLKYSVSEWRQEKSVTIIDLKAKGDREIFTVPLKPLRDLRKVEGTYEEITLRSNYLQTNQEDLVAIVLKDEEEIPEAINRLRAVYPNILQLTYDNLRSRNRQELVLGEIRQESPLELFKQFYQIQNNRELTEEQLAIVEEILEEDEV